ncbi:AMP-binding protein [Thalassobaculum salexigens]|uniref:AMP-binding protein n=1 Tax=Thalassobaculum salexigens TaxID=455360 RepID=UPI00248EFFD0|nr:AMP-binding protein [Thalassobaculum salexigens]
MSVTSAAPSAETCVLRYALERHAATRGNDVYAVFEEGGGWTFAETLARVRATAAGLQRLGVGRGDAVLVMMPNGAFGLRAIFGANYIGAVSVPVNPAYRGAILEHVVADSGATVAVVHPDCLDRLLEVSTAALTRIVVAAPEPGREAPDGLALYGEAVLLEEGREPEPLDAPIAPWDTQSIIFTSGTTGRSKGVLSSYLHCYTAMNPDTWTCTRADDRHLLHMPIFHIGGAFIASMALCVGASIAVVERFRTDDFWPVVRRLEVTCVFLLGAMATFLLKQPPREDDRDHPLRAVMIVPLGQAGPPFRERFGVDVYTLFNMTEISTPLISGANPGKPNICGRPRDGVEVRLVDANDIPVADGMPGELIIRSDAPWTMTHGYHGRPEATAAAWRNGWFHTGDMFVRDTDGDYQFVDRLKDAIRRRGENISSYEVEVEILAHPDVREAAVVAVPSDVTEDEVLAVLAPVEGRSIDPAAVIAFLESRLPGFMIPRYIRIVDALPKTPTAKVEKHVLRAAGLTPDCWDRGTGRDASRRPKIEGSSP